MTVAFDPRHSIHVARQPILDQDGRVFGYELLYRANASDKTCTAGGDLAAARGLTDALLAIGLDTLTNGAPAFINFNRALLVNRAAELLPQNDVVIELREDIPVDDEVIEACRQLHGKGYALALDDYDPESGADALLPYVKFVKIDVLSADAAVWVPLGQRLASSNVRLVAERIETAEQAAEARASGYTLFQGYYFCRPATQSARALPARRLAYLNLFAALNRPDLTIGALEDLVKRDVSLTVRLLRSVNSAAFTFGPEIHSVRHALVLLGIEHVRKWASVWAMAGLNNGGVPELVSMALLRARSCEIIGSAWSGPDAGDELFLLGLCSLLDAMLDKPMKTVVPGLHLSPGIRNALLGQTNVARSILDAVIAHERGQWDQAAETLRSLGLPEILLRKAYADALGWARELSADRAAA